MTARGGRAPAAMAVCALLIAAALAAPAAAGRPEPAGPGAAAAAAATRRLAQVATDRPLQYGQAYGGPATLVGGAAGAPAAGGEAALEAGGNPAYEAGSNPAWGRMQQGYVLARTPGRVSAAGVAAPKEAAPVASKAGYGDNRAWGVALGEVGPGLPRYGGDGYARRG